MFTEIFTEMVRERSRDKTRNGPDTIGLRVVGAAGLEPATSCSRSRRATGLRYAPLCKYHNNLPSLCNCEKTGMCN